MKRPLVPALVLLWASALFAGNALDEKERSLRQYERKLGEQRGQIKTLSVRERSLHNELKESATKIDRLNDEMARLEKEKAETSEQIERTSRAISDLEESIQSGKSHIQVRLRSLYMWRRPSLPRILFSSTSPSEFRRRWWLLRRWIDSDRFAIQNYQSKVGELSEKRAFLEENHRRHLKVLSALEAGRRDVSRERETRSKLLALVRNQREFYEKSVRELEQAAADLQKLIETLQREETEGDSLFAQMRGKLAPPVRGAVERTYGPYVDPKLRIKLYHKGIDLRAKEGSEIRAVFDGKVVYAGWFVGYGKVLILDHGGGYFTLYAHLSSISKNVGDKTVVGEPIGKVGDSGSLKGAYLYFELRRKGISEDPQPWFSREGS
jgi:murein hydrolase activator